MYKVRGADQKEYGPVSAEQIRQWIAEGRLHGSSPAQANATGPWQPLGLYPEFAGLTLVEQAPPVTGYAYPYIPVTNNMAVAGLVMGILSVTFGMICCGFLFSLLGIVFSCIGLSQITQNPQWQRGRSMAIAGLVLSILGVVGSVILSILLGFMPALQEAFHELAR